MLLLQFKLNLLLTPNRQFLNCATVEFGELYVIHFNILAKRFKYIINPYPTNVENRVS